MEPREYAAAVCRRWVWIVAAGIAGAAVTGALAMSAAVTYTASTALFVGVTSAAGDEGLASASRVSANIVPSLAELAMSSDVLGAAADELDPATTPENLGGRLEVDVLPDTSILQISAHAPTGSEAARAANAVAEQLRRSASAVYPVSDGRPMLRLTVLGPAEEPRFQAGTTTKRAAELGLLAGVAAGVLAAGLDQLVRPRVRDVADAGAVTTVPVLAEVYADGPRRANARRRAASLDRLRWMLRTQGAATADRRLAVVGTTRGGARSLVRELSVPGASGEEHPRPCLEVREEFTAGTEPIPVLIVVDSRRTTRRGLRAALAAADTAGVRVVGIVLDHVLPPRPGVLAHLSAALRGRSPLGAC